MSTPHVLALFVLAAGAMIAGCQRHQADRTTVAGVAPQRDTEPIPVWAVDPMRAGRNAPPTGRSLFDRAMTREVGGQESYDVPYPFNALLQRARERSGCAGKSDCVRVVLIPLGRSLQRMSAAPEFFQHPRVVAAVTDESRDPASLLLKDRLYLGYQEATGLIEVISYNEAAGRFEFQLVHDYRAGGTPRVTYARREVCAACHQNLAPIFSRATWQETNANPAIAETLTSTRGSFAGADIHAGIDIPGAIDAATDRANLLGVWQRLWRDGCGANDVAGRRCRGAVLLAALQYRLSGERGFDEQASSWRNDFIPTFRQEWRARWSHGLAIPNPDIPNRDPLPTVPASLTDVAVAHVHSRLEALQPRLPIEVWQLDSGETRPAHRFVAGLGSFFSSADIYALDRYLASPAARAQSPRRHHESECTLQRTVAAIRFDCKGADGASQLAGRAVFRAGHIVGGDVDVLAIPGSVPLHRLDILSGRADANGIAFTVQGRGLGARGTQGSAIERAELRWAGSGQRNEENRGHASIHVIDDFASLRHAIEALAVESGAESVLGKGPFNRSRVFPALAARLGAPTPPQSDKALPAPVVTLATTKPPVAGAAKTFAPFYPPCAGCHATAERTPPNFLFGSGERVAANLRQCAPRLYARLAMWRRAPTRREKVPMPPPIATTYPDDPLPPREAGALEQIAADLLRAETGRTPQLDALLANGYETLRPCLTDG
jgi:hypothetical protein